MTSRSAIVLAVCACALSSIGVMGTARAQGAQAPFTIRRPPDGAVVREKVSVQIPRASIRHGGFVALYLDDKFDVAVAPDEDDKGSKLFTYVWDTKAGDVSDGLHKIQAVLYTPAAGSDDAVSVTETGVTSVMVTVANKIKNAPSPVTLRYKYREGANLEYDRSSKAVIVGGISETAETHDEDLTSSFSKHVFDVEDSGATVALVRNRMTSLKVLKGGQETAYGPAELASSVYQELDPLGVVQYETGSLGDLDQLNAEGIFVTNSLDLPRLPSSPVVVGQTWDTYNQRLDIPGLVVAQQPKVVMSNRLVDFEWQGGYPCAKIRQTYKGTPVLPAKPVDNTYPAYPGAAVPDIQFGDIPVTGATISFERDIYLAYNSGTLVKMVRTLSVSGRTTAQIGRSTAVGTGIGAGGAIGTLGGAPPARMLGNRGGYAGAQMMNGMGGRSMFGGGGGNRHGREDDSEKGGAGTGAGFGGPGFGGGGIGRMGGQMMNRPPLQTNGGFGRGMGGGVGVGTGGVVNNPQELDRAVTLRSTTTTELTVAH